MGLFVFILRAGGGGGGGGGAGFGCNHGFDWIIFFFEVHHYLGNALKLELELGWSAEVAKLTEPK